MYKIKRLAAILLVVTPYVIMGIAKLPKNTLPTVTIPAMPTKQDVMQGIKKGKQFLFTKKARAVGAALAVLLLDKKITSSRWFIKEKEKFIKDCFEKKTIPIDMSEYPKLKDSGRATSSFTDEVFFRTPFQDWLINHWKSLTTKSAMKKRGILFDPEQVITITEDNEQFRITTPAGFENVPLQKMSEEVDQYKGKLDTWFQPLGLFGQDDPNTRFFYALMGGGGERFILQPEFELRIFRDMLVKEKEKNTYFFRETKPAKETSTDSNFALYLLRHTDNPQELLGKNKICKYYTVIIDDMIKHKNGDTSKTNLVSIYQDVYVNRRAFTNSVYWHIIKKLLSKKS